MRKLLPEDELLQLQIQSLGRKIGPAAAAENVGKSEPRRPVGIEKLNREYADVADTGSSHGAFQPMYETFLFGSGNHSRHAIFS
jgi:hypothetical protein